MSPVVRAITRFFSPAQPRRTRIAAPPPPPISAPQRVLARTQPGRAQTVPERKGTVKQATPIQRIVYGEARIGGAFFFYEVIPPYLYIGLMHSARPINAFKHLYIGGKLVPLDTAGHPLAAPYFSLETPRVEVQTQDGLSLDEPIYPILDTDFAILPATFRLPGIASSLCKFYYGGDAAEFELLWGNVTIPDIQWVVDGTPVYDPRDPAQRLPADLRDVVDLYDAMASWQYSNTAALVRADWAMMPYGLNAGSGNIDWDRVAAAADFDEEQIGLKGGGSQKRYAIDGMVSLDESPLSVMEQMDGADRGFTIVRSGQVQVNGDQPEQPVFTITEQHLVGGFAFRDSKPKRDLVNTARCRFVAPDRAYQEADGPVRIVQDFLAIDGEPFEQTVTLIYTSTHQRAQRILKAFVDEARLGKALSGTFSLRCLGLTEGTVVRVEFARYPSANGLYKVEQWELAGDFSEVTLSLTEYDPAISIDWDASSDEQDFAVELTSAI